MALHPIRIALYAALAAFSVIVIGMTSARVHYTKSRHHTDPIKGGTFSYYDPIIVELLVTYIFAFLWSIWAMFTIGTRTDLSFMTSYVLEYFWLFIIWVLGLVGASIATHYWHGNLADCRHFNNQCRLLIGIVAWSWINWALVTFIIVASLFSLRTGELTMKAPFHGREGEEYPGPEVRNTPGGGAATHA